MEKKYQKSGRKMNYRGPKGQNYTGLLKCYKSGPKESQKTDK